MEPLDEFMKKSSKEISMKSSSRSLWWKFLIELREADGLEKFCKVTVENLPMECISEEFSYDSMKGFTKECLEEISERIVRGVSIKMCSTSTNPCRNASGISGKSPWNT